jgi:hypothetical protein
MGILRHLFPVICTIPLLAAGASRLDAQPAPAGAKPGQPLAELPIPPARYAGGGDIETYIKSLADSLSISSRTADPFGQLQDPDAKPAVLAPAVRNAAPPEPVTPFSAIVPYIQVTTVMSREKRFLVGSRSISEGEQFPINYQGKLINVQVMEVSAQQIQFKNLETGEIAAQKMNALPPGMTPGKNLPAPGMTPAGSNTPLELQIGPPR